MELRQSLPYRLLRNIYMYILERYDAITCKWVTISIGDILVPQGELSENQILLFTRYLDAKAFLDNTAKDFPLQNRISYATYGSAHDEAHGNQAFAELIASYQESGYTGSYTTCDRHLHLMDGNHRMGMNALFGVQTVCCRILRRTGKVGKHTYRQYLKLGFSEAELERFCREYRQMFLSLAHHSFLCIFPEAAEADVISLLPKDVCTVERIYSAPYQGQMRRVAELQLVNPNFHGIKNGYPYSVTAAEIESYLHERVSPAIVVTKSITEAAAIQETLNMQNNT